jgi:hypothetical protein
MLLTDDLVYVLHHKTVIIYLEDTLPLSSSSSFSAVFASKELPISSKASENSA